MIPLSLLLIFPLTSFIDPKTPQLPSFSSSAPLASPPLHQKQNYTARMSSKNMPVSPHVMIYAFPVVAWGSVAVRATGVMLWAGMSGIACLSAAGVDPTPIMQSIGDSGLAIPAKLCVAFPMSYHFLGGVRHAYWDATPEAVTNEQVERAR